MFPNPFDSQGGYPANPGNRPQQSISGMYRDAEMLGFVCAFLTTIIVGPIVADFTEPYARALFEQRYAPDVAEFFITVWDIGMWVLVWSLSKAFLVGMIVTLIIGIYVRFPALLGAA